MTYNIVCALSSRDFLSKPLSGNSFIINPEKWIGLAFRIILFVFVLSEVALLGTDNTTNDEKSENNNINLKKDRHGEGQKPIDLKVESLLPIGRIMKDKPSSYFAGPVWLFSATIMLIGIGFIELGNVLSGDSTLWTKLWSACFAISYILTTLNIVPNLNKDLPISKLIIASLILSFICFVFTRGQLDFKRILYIVFFGIASMVTILSNEDDNQDKNRSYAYFANYMMIIIGVLYDYVFRHQPICVKFIK